MFSREDWALFGRLFVLGLCLIGIGYVTRVAIWPAPSKGVLSCVTGETGDGLCRLLLRLDR